MSSDKFKMPSLKPAAGKAGAKPVEPSNPAEVRKKAEPTPVAAALAKRVTSFSVPKPVTPLSILEDIRLEAEADPEVKAKAEREIQRLIDRSSPITNIEKMATRYGVTTDYLKEIKWFDADGRLTRSGMIGTRLSGLPSSGSAPKTNPGSKSKTPTAAKVQAPAPVKKAEEEWSPVPEVANRLSAGKIYQDHFEGPAKERIAFMHKVAASRGQALTGDTGRLDPVAISSTPGHEDVTLTADTFGDYMDIGRRLDAQYRLELGFPSDFGVEIDLSDFAAWILVRSEMRQWAQTTVRRYRAALSTWVSSTYGDEALVEFPIFVSDLYTEVDGNEPDLSLSERPERVKNGRKKSERGPAMKKKFFRHVDMKRITYYLRYRSKSPFAPILLDWLVAGVLTGLRPIEWRLTYLEEGVGEFSGEPYSRFYVMNAKATNGRSNGVVRTLDVRHLSPKAIAAIKRMSDAGFQYFQLGDDAFERLQQGCSKLLTQACENALTKRGNRYSLYSLRHQFIANCKAIYLEPEEISAMAGHRDVMVNMAVYGRRDHGWPTQVLAAFPRPTPGDLRRMQKFTNAKAKYNAKYAGIVDARNFVITDEQLGEIELF